MISSNHPREDRTERYCIIGAGSSGLTVAKNFLEQGIPFDCLEREDDLGGNWNFGKPASSVYASTHLISSKGLTEYTDFPMPEEYPPYPSHRQALAYLRSYAEHFGIFEHIEFSTSVERIDQSGEFWDVRLDGGRQRRYRGVVIANGHNWDPKRPEFPGEFSGQVLHSADYKTPDVLRGKRVLVVGAGNSGCDIAVEAAQNAAKTFHSHRRGYHFLPKFFLGWPIDQCGERLLALRLPVWLRRAMSASIVRMIFGPSWRTGLPQPDHKLFESHPIINSQLMYYVGHGDIAIKPDVAELRGDRVRFADGSEEEIDVIVCATGFRITIPFVDREHLNWRDGRPDLYLNIFHPQYDNLFVAGLIQPDSGQWGLVDYQAQLIARFIGSLASSPRRAAAFRRRKSSERPDLGRGIRYVNSTRHLLEVEHFSYRNRLKRQLARLR